MAHFQSVRIIAFPKSGTAYTDGFYRALEARGGIVIEGMFSGKWLYKNVQKGDWVHLHWPSFNYATNGGVISNLKSYARWVTLLLYARVKGARLIWTAHNMLPHSRTAIPCLDILGRHFVIRFSDAIFVHGEHAAGVLGDRFSGVRNKLILIPHGNWIGYYTITQTRENARAELSIPSGRFLFLFVGSCMPYKNVDSLVRDFRAMPNDAVLVVAGKFSNNDYYNQIMALAEGDSRIHIIPGFVPNERMQTYLLACDAVVAPYRDVLTSGTAMLALSFGRPIVTVALGFLKDVVNPDVGLLFTPDAPNGLTNALHGVMTRNYDEARILAEATRYRFDDAALQFVTALRDIDKNHLPNMSCSYK